MRLKSSLILAKIESNYCTTSKHFSTNCSTVCWLKMGKFELNSKFLKIKKRNLLEYNKAELLENRDAEIQI